MSVCQPSAQTFLLAATLMLAGVGCLPATQTFIELDADESLRISGRRLTVEIKDRDGLVVYERRGVSTVAPFVWPTEIPVSPDMGDASRRFSIAATLSGESGQVSVRAELGFAQGRQVRVQLLFEEACVNVSCGDGFVCLGGACVSSFLAPDECGLVGGRGCDPTTNCGCPESFSCVSSTEGTTCRARLSTAVCVTTSECGAGQVCRFDTGTCETPRCQSALPSTGTGEGGDVCETNAACGEGLTCVGSHQRNESTGFDYSEESGRCRASCDPCNTEPTCPSPNECLSLPQGGGFCTRGGLGNQGDTCSDIVGSERLCTPGHQCLTGRCARTCRADFGPGAGTRGDWCLAESGDCPEGQTCSGPRSSSREGICVSVGEEYPSPEGGLCTVNTPCPCPLSCLSRASDLPRFCGRTGLCAECPPDTLCRERVSGGDGGVACIRRNSLRQFDPCGTSEECESSTECRDGICQIRPRP